MRFSFTRHQLLQLGGLCTIWLTSSASYCCEGSPDAAVNATACPELSSPELNRPELNQSVAKPAREPRCATHFSLEGVDAGWSSATENEAPAGDQRGAVTIRAKQIDYQPDGQLTLDGQVEIIRGTYRAQSTQAMIDQATEQARLQGKIIIQGPDMQLSGDSASMDMVNEQLSVTQAQFFSPSTRMNGSADEISRTGPSTLVIKDGQFTTCEPDDRSWSFAASDITLDQASGFGSATHTRFQILDVPVLYVPWFSFPLDDRRKSGFLYPTIGTSNTGQGLFLATPYYLNLAANYDATVTPTYIDGRGAHTELEARHLSPLAESTLSLGYIAKDQHYLDDQPVTSDNDGERWGLSFQQILNLAEYGPGWLGQLDYSEVSDNDYLVDLNQGLQIYNDKQLDRRADLSFTNEHWQFRALLQQYKSLDETLLPSEAPYQRLPEVNIQGYQRFGPIRFDWQSQYVYFFRDKSALAPDDRSFGSRLRERPKLSLPLHQSWGYFTPALTVDQTDYVLQDYTPETNHISRTIPTYEMDSGLLFDRPSGFLDATLNHSLEPRLYYVYTPERQQDEIPNFDAALPNFNYQRLFTANRFSGGDRIGDSNRLTLGITSRWSEQATGIDRLRFSLGQIYHYDDRSVGLEGLGTSERTESLYASELMLRPFTHVEIAMSGLWDPRINNTQEGNTQVSFHTEDYRTVLNLGHRFISRELEQSDSSIIFPLTDRISFMGRWRYDLQDRRTIGTLSGLEYNSCCWRIQLLAESYLTDESEISNSVLFLFQLKGLGGFGANSDSMDDHIPGYKIREEYFN